MLLAGFVADACTAAALALEEHLKALSELEAGAQRSVPVAGSERSGDGVVRGWPGEEHWETYFKQIER